MNKLKQLIMLLCIAVLSGCASNHMNVVNDTTEKLTPAPGKALVVFVRTSMVGGAMQATLFDDEKYIGTISTKTKVAYQVTPGKHMFMVIAESADFMEADLEAGKIYYAGVVVRMGVWTARFSFHPNNKQISDNELKNWISETKLVEANDKGQQWAEANKESIKSKRAKYLPVWNSKNDASKQRLDKSSGY